MMQLNKRFKVYMPILESVYNILYGKGKPEQEIKRLSETFR